MYHHILVLQPPTQGYLDGAHPFALGSSSAMNVHVHLSVSLSSSLLGVYLGKDLLYHVATLHLTFGERPGFPKKLPHFTILPAKQESASFSTSSFDQ